MMQKINQESLKALDIIQRDQLSVPVDEVSET
jgi:hypothetical protein